MAEEGAKIEYEADNSKQCMYMLEAMCEGIVQANQVWLHYHPDCPHNLIEGGVVYEDPRPASEDDLDQAIGVAPVLFKRGKATCVEMACFEAARWRQLDIDADVELIPRKGKYGIIDYEFHAVVKLPDGKILDPTRELPGYNDHGSWWQNAGHCCSTCAMGKKCPGDKECPEVGERIAGTPAGFLGQRVRSMEQGKRIAAAKRAQHESKLGGRLQ